MSLIELNLGGVKKMTVLETTLLGSDLLKTLLKYNKIDNTLYVDCHPDLFIIVLEYLRIGHIINNQFDTEVIVGLFGYYFGDLIEDMIRKIYKIQSIGEQVFAGNKVITFTESTIVNFSPFIWCEMNIQNLNKYKFQPINSTHFFSDFTGSYINETLSITKLHPMDSVIIADIKKWYSQPSHIRITDVYDNRLGMTIVENADNIVAIKCYVTYKYHVEEFFYLDVHHENEVVEISYTSCKDTFKKFCDHFMSQNPNLTLYNYLTKFTSELLATPILPLADPQQYQTKRISLSDANDANDANTNNDIFLLKTEKKYYILKCEENIVIVIEGIKLIKRKHFFQLSF